MLKSINPVLDISTKCGVVFYTLPSVFEIFCNECGERILFHDFVEHFRQQHLVNEETIISIGHLRSPKLEKNSSEAEDGDKKSKSTENEKENNKENNDDDDEEEIDVEGDGNVARMKVNANEVETGGKDKTENVDSKINDIVVQQDPNKKHNRKTSVDSLDDSETSSFIFDNDEDLSVDEQEFLFYNDDDQEYIDSIEQIPFDDDEDSLSDHSLPNSKPTANNLTSINEILKKKSDEKHVENVEEDAFSDEGTFEYVLFEEEIEPNSVVEQYEPEDDTKDEDDDEDEEMPEAEKTKLSKGDNTETPNNKVSKDIEKENTNDPDKPADTGGIDNNDKTFECYICHHILESEYNLKYHMKEIHGPKSRKFQCKTCGTNLATSFELIVHKRKIHPEIYNKPAPQPDPEQENNEKRPIPCPLCSRRFRNGNSLSAHMRVHNFSNDSSNNKVKEGKSITCTICGKISRSPKFYYMHMMGMHGSTFCTICETTFATPAEALRHKMSHKNNKRFECKQCDTTCFTSRGLARHMQTHLEDYQKKKEENCENSIEIRSNSRDRLGPSCYVCEICGQTLRNITLLKAHMQRHKNDRPFSCDICNKSFFNRGTLKSHMNIHSDERPFFCTVCGATFQYKRALKTHMILHSDKRDHKCKYCDKAYVEAARLRYHIRLKHGCKLTDTLPEPKKLMNASRKRNRSPKDKELELATKSLEEIVSLSE